MAAADGPALNPRRPRDHPFKALATVLEDVPSIPRPWPVFVRHPDAVRNESIDPTDTRDKTIFNAPVGFPFGRLSLRSVTRRLRRVADQQ